MRVKMTNKRFKTGANVLPDDVPTWEAAGWVAEQKPIKLTKKEESE
jgi:hypothetical protein